MKPPIHIAVMLLALMTSSAFGADLCKAVALRDVPAIESPASIIPKGGIDAAITQYRVEKATGIASFCSHGGYCYPTHVFINGRKVEALRLTNCKIGKRDPFPDKEYTFYDVDVDRSKNSASDLRYDDLDNQLLTLGLCSACASNAAMTYLKKPKSKCGRLVKAALEGNRKALEAIKDGPDYCNSP